MSKLSQIRVADEAVDVAQPAQDRLETLSELFKSLGDGLRLQILRVLRNDSFSVSELCQVFDLRQSALSHHLKVLVNADLLVRRRDGTIMFYRRQTPLGEDVGLRSQLLETIDRTPLPEQLLARVEEIQLQREANSLAFFQDNAKRFKDQKELIASSDDYSDATLHFIDRLGHNKIQRVLEIGPGDGSLLPGLAARAEEVVALDNSRIMLETARIAASDLLNVRFLCGDTSSHELKPQSFDGIVANMVLHHTPHPEQIMKEAASCIAPGGFFIISELCAHDQAWAREHCGDLWLGFAPDDLDQWAKDAGLNNQAEVFIAQRNGFRIQVKLYQRAG